MPKLINSLLFFLAVFATSACQEGSFNGEAQQARGARAKLCTPTKTKKCEKVPTKPGNPWDPNDPNDPNDPTDPINPTNPSLLSTDGGGVCLLKAPIIDFVFAMDVSGSMQPQSNRVNNAFSQLTKNLANISIPGLGKVEKVRIGLVTYEDNIIFQSPLNDKLDIVSSQIKSNFNAFERGTDGEEAGLLAAGTALQIANDDTESIKVLFIVTDAFSHDGAPRGFLSPRTYSTAAIEQQLAAPKMKMSFIYSASDFSSGNGSTPPGISNAVDQWKKIRSNAAAVGGHGPFGKDYDVYDFTDSQVSNDIPIDIGKQLRKCN
jgi:hypothetical protein